MVEEIIKKILLLIQLQEHLLKTLVRDIKMNQKIQHHLNLLKILFQCPNIHHHKDWNFPQASGPQILTVFLLLNLWFLHKILISHPHLVVLNWGSWLHAVN
ncbi:unnamed protein product [Meganyctiphanes norvegica]|uniref:Uncharacterized protein n=1 Tax=Meganyctiphanes norvegica TaxID=48144 RepID=A0AAV2PHJ8_MEGNR